MSESPHPHLIPLELHLEHSPMALVTWLHDGRYLQWSKSAERMFGYTEAEVVTDQCLVDFRHVHPEDRAGLMEWIGKLTRGEIARFSLEHRNIRKDGKVIWCLWHNARAITAAGAPPIYLSYAIDTTERVQAEQDIRHAREVLESHLNDSPMAVVEWDEQFRVVRWSRGAEQISGYSAGEMIGESISDFSRLFHPEEIQLLRQRMQKLVTGQWPHASHVYRCVRRDGQVRWVDWHSSVISRQNRVISVLSHGIDITGRVQAETQLRQARETLESHLNNSQMAVVEWGPDFRFLRWTPGAQSVLGYSSREMLGTRFDLMDPPLIYREDYERVMQHVAEILGGRSGHATILARNHRKDGSIRWINWHSTSVFDSAGKLVSVLSQGIDMTDQVLAEQLISAAKERAEAASKAKDRFIAILSHELRTPLTPVRALLSVMRTDARLPQDVRADLETITRSVEAESRLIDDLLDVTSLSHGQLAFSMQPCDLHAIVSQALTTFSTSAQQKTIKLVAELKASEATINGDPQRLTQVIGNLLSNAIKFTPQGGSVRVQSDNPSPDTLRLRVVDTGVGIDPEHLPHLFEPFERGEARHRYEFTGLGLGLTIAKSLLNLMQGTITAQSSGQHTGATFIIMLPTAPDLRASAAVQAPVSQPPATRAEPLSILLVEDHAATAEIIARLLRRDGHSVSNASSVAAAVAIARTLQFRLIICDIGLPDGTGHDLLRQLREMNQAAPAIALSGYGMASDIEESRAAGFVEHLTKPVDFATLEQAIARVISSDPSRPAR